jgi:small basic protein
MVDMAVIDQLELPSQGKSMGDLGREALWFAIHTALAALILGVVVVGMMMANAPDTATSKIVGAILALVVPMLGGFLIARLQGYYVAGYVWVSGLILFGAVCVWVLDLPTGPGLCETCGAVGKLVRTFFDVNHGSGLMSGEGFLVGSLLPLAMFGYAAGARIALSSD